MRYIFGIVIFLGFSIAGINTAADEYNQLYPFYEGIAAARKTDGELVMINDQGLEVFSLSKLNLTNWGYRFSEGLMVVSEKGKKGFVDKTGNMIIPPRYDWAEPFSEGLAVVNILSFLHNSLEKKAGYIRKNGEIAIPLIYSNAVSFHDGRAFVYKDTGWFLIDQTGKFLSDESFEVIHRGFSEGLAPVRANNHRWGYIDTEGKWKIPPRFIIAFSFHEGFACVVAESQGWSFIDRDGNVVFWDIADVLPQGSSLTFYDGWAIVPVEEGLNGPASVKYKYGYFSTGGKWLPAIYDFAFPFSDGVAVVRIGKDVGAIDHDGNWVFQLGEYEDLTGFISEGKLAAKKKGKWGYINMKGEWLF
jgi:hypothetical protein